jgi:hypothetical protein
LKFNKSAHHLARNKIHGLRAISGIARATRPAADPPLLEFIDGIVGINRNKRKMKCNQYTNRWQVKREEGKKKKDDNVNRQLHSR